MEQWQEVPKANQTLLHRLRGMLVHGARLLAALVVRCWLRGYHRLTIVGRHNLPVGRSFMLIANHASHLDTLCLLAALPMSRLHRAFPAAARDYFYVSAARAFLAAVVVNVLSFDRHKAPWQSLSACAQLLEDSGNILIFFPEGTRSGNSEPEEFKPGVAILAAGHDIPVVPCHLAGTHAALPKGSWFPRPKVVRLTIGQPRTYARWPATRESTKHICRELREAVISLGRAEPFSYSSDYVALPSSQDSTPARTEVEHHSASGVWA
jgi:1-acyl-sn-glycerol-3-phosphate acyltransferase